MKRIFYGMVAASLLLAGGCMKDSKSDDLSTEMSAEELAAAEEEAVRELAKIIAEEAGEMSPMAEGDMIDPFAADFDRDSLSPEELAQLELWEAEAQQWAEEEMALAAAEAEQLGLKSIQFEEGSAELGADQQDALAADIEVARGLLADGRDVLVQGHVNAMEDADQGLALSEQRANAVRDAMIDAGLEGDRIQAIAYADSLQKELGSSPVNDRVELAVA